MSGSFGLLESVPFVQQPGVAYPYLCLQQGKRVAEPFERSKNRGE